MICSIHFSTAHICKPTAPTLIGAGLVTRVQGFGHTVLPIFELGQRRFGPWQEQWLARVGQAPSFAACGKAGGKRCDLGMFHGDGGNGTAEARTYLCVEPQSPGLTTAAE